MVAKGLTIVLNLVIKHQNEHFSPPSRKIRDFSKVLNLNLSLKIVYQPASSKERR
jgi:hypothetical protein